MCFFVSVTPRLQNSPHFHYIFFAGMCRHPPASGERSAQPTWEVHPREGDQSVCDKGRGIMAGVAPDISISGKCADIFEWMFV